MSDEEREQVLRLASEMATWIANATYAVRRDELRPDLIDVRREIEALMVIGK